MQKSRNCSRSVFTNRRDLTDKVLNRKQAGGPFLEGKFSASKRIMLQYLDI